MSAREVELLLDRVWDVLHVVLPAGFEDARVQLRSRNPGLEITAVAVEPEIDAPRVIDRLRLTEDEYFGILHGLLLQLDEIAPTLSPKQLLFRGSENKTYILSNNGREHDVKHPPEHSHGWVFSPSLLEALIEARPSIGADFRLFAAEAEGHDDWKYESTTRRLELLRGVLPWRSYDAAPIGTYKKDEGVFAWAWAGADWPEDLTRPLHAYGQASPFAAMVTPAFPCDEVFGALVASYANQQRGGRAVYAAEGPEGVVYFGL